MPRNKYGKNSARYWSEPMMMDLVYRNNLPFTLPVLRILSSVEWDLLGDWLYYRCNQNEKDPVKNRPVPELPMKAGYV